jgi:hypothetical protein
MPSPRLLLSAAIIGAATVLFGCGDKPSSSAVAGSATATQKKSSASESLAALHARATLPKEVVFSEPVKVPSVHEVAAMPRVITDPATVAALERIQNRVSAKSTDDAVTRSDQDVRAISDALELLRDGEPGRARSLLESLPDKLAATALLAFADAMYGSGSTTQAIGRLAEAANALPRDVLIHTTSGLLLRAPTIDGPSLARLVLAEEDNPSPAQLAGLVQNAKFFDSASRYVRFEMASGFFKYPQFEGPQAVLFHQTVSAVWREIADHEREITSQRTPPTKGEFETTDQFNSRKAAFEQELALAVAAARGEQQARFRAQLNRELGKFPPWELTDLTYDADREEFSGKISTHSAESVIAARFPVKRTVASELKSALHGAIVVPIIEAPIDGELTFVGFHLVNNYYAMVSATPWKTGIALSEASAQAYTKLVQDAAHEVREAQAKRDAAEAQRRAAQEEKLRLAEANAEREREAERERQRKKAGKRLAEYRDVIERLQAHQSAKCRQIVSGIPSILAYATVVDDSSEQVFKMVQRQADLSRCL